MANIDEQAPSAVPALYAQTDITARCRLSRSHIYNLVERGLFPKPAVRIGPKFTRWAAHEVDEWARDPQGWIDRNAPITQGAA